jgi:hypothetical protein
MLFSLHTESNIPLVDKILFVCPMSISPTELCQEEEAEEPPEDEVGDVHIAYHHRSSVYCLLFTYTIIFMSS